MEDLQTTLEARRRLANIQNKIDDTVKALRAEGLSNEEIAQGIAKLAAEIENA